MNLKATYALSFVLACTALGACTRQHPPSQPPNVIIITMDTVRSDHCSAYGYNRETTPNLAKLAGEGALFTRAYAPTGATAPSHATLFTSKFTLAHGLVKNGQTLGRENTTLAETLGENGYQTAAIVSSFVLDSKFGLDQGFAHYDDVFNPMEATIHIPEWEGQTLKDPFDRRGDYTTERALEWLSLQRKEPFFLFIHYFDPHFPYEPIAPYDSMFVDAQSLASPLADTLRRHDAEIAFTDQQIARLLNAVDSLGLKDNTIIIVTADHGEGLMQRGYMLHGLRLYDEEVHIPLIIRWPNGIAAAQTLDMPCSLMDIAPTVLALAGVSAPAEEYQGKSLAEILTEDSRPFRNRPLYFHRRPYTRTYARSGWDGPLAAGEISERVLLDGEQFGILKGNLKFIIAPNEGTQELFDLEDDPRETNNLFGLRQREAVALKRELEEWVRTYAQPETRSRQMDPNDQRRLESLGYIQ